MAAQLVQAVFTPNQMVNFFGGRLLHGVAGAVVFSGKCLALIQRLRAHFAGMIDAHQPRNMLALGFMPSERRIGAIDISACLVRALCQGF